MTLFLSQEEHEYVARLHIILSVQQNNIIHIQLTDVKHVELLGHFSNHPSTENKTTEDNGIYFLYHLS